MSARLSDRPSVVESLPGWAHALMAGYIVSTLTLLAGVLA